MRKRGLTRRHRKPRGSCVPRPRMQRARPASRLQRFGEARRDRWRRIARVCRASSFSDRQRTARGSPPGRKSIPPHMSSRNGMRFAASSPGTRPRPFAASHKRHPLPRPSPCNEQRVMGFSGIGTASRLRVVVYGHRRALLLVESAHAASARDRRPPSIRRRLLSQGQHHVRPCSATGARRRYLQSSTRSIDRRAKRGARHPTSHSPTALRCAAYPLDEQDIST